MGVWLFCLYVFFSMFCVLNIITGVFVENAHNMSCADEDKMLVEHLESKIRWLAEVRTLFMKADEGQKETIEFQNFCQLLTDVRVQFYFNRLGINAAPDNAYAIFQLLDVEGSGSINLDMFVQGIQQLQGSARSIDVFQLKQLISLACERKMPKAPTRVRRFPGADASRTLGHGIQEAVPVQSQVVETTFGVKGGCS